jgi:predicted  nucleic acid-binding Zn ribbon protein
MCPACGGVWAVLLGALGRLTHLRCRDCGIVYSVPSDELEDA